MCAIVKVLEGKLRTLFFSRRWGWGNTLCCVRVGHSPLAAHASTALPAPAAFTCRHSQDLGVLSDMGMVTKGQRGGSAPINAVV